MSQENVEIVRTWVEAYGWTDFAPSDPNRFVADFFLHELQLGWGPKGREFKSRRPDQPEA